MSSDQRSTELESRILAARGSANWEAGWEARRGGAGWAKTSQAGSAEAPRRRQPVGVSFLRGKGAQAEASGTEILAQAGILYRLAGCAPRGCRRSSARHLRPPLGAGARTGSTYET